MLAIGARPRFWTVLLLLACSPIAHAQSAQRNDDPVPSPSLPTPDSSSLPGASQQQAHSVTAGRPTSQTQLASYDNRTCAVPATECITRTLVEQCIETRWAAPTHTGSPRGAEAAREAPGAAWAGIPWIREMTEEDVTAVREGRERPDATKATPARASLAEAEAEADSPLDNADFLSFEEWKKKNLARAGQSPENVGHGRAASTDQKARRRPVNINALDALGEENEIDIDFSGFGNSDSESGGTAPVQSVGEPSRAADGDDKVAPTSFSLSKDAGKTCKERFNYASYDCAAAILKTNDRAKSSSAVLVENKDSYMLNECSATNKFIIVELCDDILVDTVVLANYEFFSSMFRHFRVSVSDRYPVKLDRWRTLGEFEARNTREIQPFLITAPQIWARYLRIEFLTHYGNEFYCPLSLLRVHGTTMMEQFRREEEQARGDDDFAEPIEEAAEVEPVKTAVEVVENRGKVPAVQVSVEQEKQRAEATKEQAGAENNTDAIESAQLSTTPVPSSEQDRAQTADESTSCSSIGATDVSKGFSTDNATATSSTQSPTAVPAQETTGSQPKKSSVSSASAAAETVSPSRAAKSKDAANSPEPNKPSTAADASIPSQSSSNKHSTDSTSSETTQPQSSQQPAQQPPQQPPAHRPTPQTVTQESFYKSIHKRLQSLESNSTLSLQYVEDQARMLRSALSAIEKRQLSKTENFLANIEASVQHEFEARRQREEKRWAEMLDRMERLERRVLEQEAVTGVRLTAVADGLVWQKRMAVVQSTLVLVLLVGVLLVAAGRGEGAAQYVPLSLARGRNDSVYGGQTFESPDRSPRSPETENQPSVGLRRRRSAFRNIWRSDASERSHISDVAAAASDAETDGRRSPLSGEVTRVRYTSPESASGDVRRSASSLPEQSTEKDLPTHDDDDQGSNPSAHRTGLPSPSPSPSPSPLASPSPSPSPSEQEQKQLQQGEADQHQDQEQARRLEALATQSGPATPRGSRDAQPSWEEVDRAVELLKAGERVGDQGGQAAKTALSTFRAKRKGKKENRSPLRRAESYDDSPGTDDGVGGMGL